MSVELKNILWQEKYRPEKIENLISNSKEKLQEYISNSTNIPNFLFVSLTPGTGKTSAAKAIINELGCDSLIINSSDERGVEVVRERIKEFAKTQSSNGIRKVVFLDEIDGMTNIAQQSLRNLMETYSSNVFFILTCNYENKIIEPLQNRCVRIEFNKPNKEEIKKYIKNICQKEELDYSEEGLNKLIEVHYPSIRGIVNNLQDLKTQNKKVLEENISEKNEVYKSLWEDMKKLKFTNVWQIIKGGNGVDVEIFNKWIFNNLLKDDDLDLIKKMKLIKVLAENERTMRFGDSIIIFSSSLVDMITILRVKE